MPVLCALAEYVLVVHVPPLDGISIGSGGLCDFVLLY